MWHRTNFNIVRVAHARNQDVAKGTASASNSEYLVQNGANARFVTIASHLWQRFQQKRRKCREIRVQKMRQLILLRKVRMEKTKKVVIKQNKHLQPIKSSRENKKLLIFDQSVLNAEISQVRRLLLGISSHQTWRILVWVETLVRSKGKRVSPYR